MTRTLKSLAGAIFGLCLAALIPFLVEKGAEPKGHVALWILYGALLVSGVMWSIATTVTRIKTKPKELEVEYSLDNSMALKVSLRRKHPQFVLLRVAIRNLNPFNIQGVAINSLWPESFHAIHCGSHGERLAEGRWLTTLEPLPDDPESNVYKDCWADDDLTVAGSGSKHLFFRLRVADPGDFYLMTMLFGSAPQQRADACLNVSSSLTMTVGGTIGELLFDGEVLAEAARIHDPNEFLRWNAKLSEVVRSLSDEDRQWWDGAVFDAPPVTANLDQASLVFAIASRIPSLYDLRRRLERPSEPLKRMLRGGMFKGT